MGKESELFGVSFKNIDRLEQGLAPSGLGKRTVHLFLEQIEDMLAYPRYHNTKSSEGVGELVQVVTTMNSHAQGKRGGLTDMGWKTKHCNSLAYIHSSEELNEALTYILEEQHTFLETCAGYMESILINAHVKENTTTFMVSKSVAFCIASDTLTRYLSLLNHLSGVVNTHG